MTIVLSIGIYYKIQNNKYNNTVTGANYESYQYRKLRDKYPNFYFFKIKNIKKKLIKGKRLNLAQKQIMKDFLIYYGPDRGLDINYIMQIKNDEEFTYLFSDINNKKEKNNMIDFNKNNEDFLYNASNFEEGKSNRKFNGRYIKSLLGMFNRYKI